MWLLQNLGCGSAGAVLQMCQCAVGKFFKTFGAVCVSPKLVRKFFIKMSKYGFKMSVFCCSDALIGLLTTPSYTLLFQFYSVYFPYIGGVFLFLVKIIPQTYKK